MFLARLAIHHTTIIQPSASFFARLPSPHVHFRSLGHVPRARALGTVHSPSQGHRLLTHVRRAIPRRTCRRTPAPAPSHETHIPVGSLHTRTRFRDGSSVRAPYRYRSDITVLTAVAKRKPTDFSREKVKTLFVFRKHPPSHVHWCFRGLLIGYQFPRHRSPSQASCSLPEP